MGQLNLADSTSNEWYITGVQLEAGDQATDFEHLPFDINLLRCQRYCEVLCDTRSSDTGTFSSGDADESLGVLGACHGTRYAYMTLDSLQQKGRTLQLLYLQMIQTILLCIMF